MTDVHVFKTRHKPPPNHVLTWLEGTWILGSRHKLDLFAMDERPTTSWVLRSFTLEPQGKLKLDYDYEFISDSPEANDADAAASLAQRSRDLTPDISSPTHRPEGTTKSPSISPNFFGRRRNVGGMRSNKDPTFSVSSPSSNEATQQMAESLPNEPFPDLIPSTEDDSETRPIQRTMARSLGTTLTTGDNRSPLLPASTSGSPDIDVIGDDSKDYSSVNDVSPCFSSLQSLVPDSEAVTGLVNSLPTEILTTLETATEEGSQISDSDYSQLNRELLHLPAGRKLKNVNTVMIPDYSNLRTSQTDLPESQLPSAQQYRHHPAHIQSSDMAAPLLKSEHSGLPEHTMARLPEPDQMAPVVYEREESLARSHTYASGTNQDWQDTASVLSGAESSASLFSVAPTVDITSKPASSTTRMQACAGGTWRVELGTSATLKSILQHHIEHIHQLKHAESQATTKANPLPLHTSGKPHAFVGLQPTHMLSKPSTSGLSSLKWKALSRCRSFLLFLDVEVMGVPMNFSLLVRLRSGIKRRRRSSKTSTKPIGSSSKGLLPKWISRKHPHHQTRASGTNIPFSKPHADDVVTARLLYCIHIPRVESHEEDEPRSCLIPEDQISELCATLPDVSPYSHPDLHVSDISLSTLPNPWDSLDPNLQSITMTTQHALLPSSSELQPEIDTFTQPSRQDTNCCCGSASGNDVPSTPLAKQQRAQQLQRERQRRANQDPGACWCAPQRRVPPRKIKDRSEGAVTIISVGGSAENSSVTEAGANPKTGSQESATIGEKKTKTKVQWAPGSLVEESSDEEDDLDEVDNTQAEAETKLQSTLESLPKPDSTLMPHDSSGVNSNQGSTVAGSNTTSLATAYTPTRHRAHFVRFFI